MFICVHFKSLENHHFIWCRSTSTFAPRLNRSFPMFRWWLVIRSITLAACFPLFFCTFFFLRGNRILTLFCGTFRTRRPSVMRGSILRTFWFKIDLRRLQIWTWIMGIILVLRQFIIVYVLGRNFVKQPSHSVCYVGGSDGIFCFYKSAKVIWYVKQFDSR